MLTNDPESEDLHGIASLRPVCTINDWENHFCYSELAQDTLLHSMQLGCSELNDMLR